MRDEDDISNLRNEVLRRKHHKDRGVGKYIVVFAITLVIGCFMSYGAGIRTASDSYNRGVSDGKKQQQEKDVANDIQKMNDWSTDPLNPIVAENKNLADKYNKLTDDYNKLQQLLIQSANTPRYQPTPSMHCTTSTLSTTTYTNCY